MSTIYFERVYTLSLTGCCSLFCKKGPVRDRALGLLSLNTAALIYSLGVSSALISISVHSCAPDIFNHSSKRSGTTTI